jgi:hypothetical protein
MSNKIKADDAIKFARALPYIASAKAWNDSRVYLIVRGNGGNYRGESTAKIYIDLASGQLVEQAGKGTTSREWSANVVSLREAFAAREVAA